MVNKIELKNLTKKFGEFIAVNNVNLSIKEGEFVTILGPSGSGKTTLLTLIAGFNNPTSGEIYIDGENVSRLPTEKRNIGIVFQSYALFPHMTVFENVAFPLQVRKISKNEIKSRVNDALKKVRLDDFGHRRINELSGGQQQRVALARAFVFEPSTLLLDEPMSALDRKLRQDLQVEMRKLHEQLRITTISVTHDQEEALTMSDKILILNNGAIEQFGTPEELYLRPQNKFVASFLGSANFFEGIIISKNGETFFRIDEKIEIPLINSTLSEGTSATLMIRPEQIKMRKMKADTKGLTGEIENVIYLGNSTKFQVKIERGDVINVENVEYQFAFKRGDRVELYWDAKSNWVIPDSIQTSEQSTKIKVI